MNYGIICYVLGYVCYFEAAFLMLPFLVSLIYQEYMVGAAYVAVAVLCSLIGLGFTHRTPQTRMYTKEGLDSLSR